jgi:hypothetical protein
MQFTHDGYEIDDFVAPSEEDSDPEQSLHALCILRLREEARRARRQEIAMGHQCHAVRQRTSRILRGLPAEEEDCPSESAGSEKDEDDNTSSSSEDATPRRTSAALQQHQDCSRRRRRASCSMEQRTAQRRRFVVVESDQE